MLTTAVVADHGDWGGGGGDWREREGCVLHTIMFVIGSADR